MAATRTIGLEFVMQSVLFEQTRGEKRGVMTKNMKHRSIPMCHGLLFDFQYDCCFFFSLYWSQQ